MAHVFWKLTSEWPCLCRYDDPILLWNISKTYLQVLNGKTRATVLTPPPSQEVCFSKLFGDVSRKSITAALILLYPCQSHGRDLWMPLPDYIIIAADESDVELYPQRRDVFHLQLFQQVLSEWLSLCRYEDPILLWNIIKTYLQVLNGETRATVLPPPPGGMYLKIIWFKA